MTLLRPAFLALGLALTPLAAAPGFASNAKAETVVKTWSTPGFFATAQEYLDFRNTEPHDQLILTYEVAGRKPGEESKGAAAMTTIMIGPDYVASKTGTTTRTYDFKLDRLLTIRPAAESKGLSEVIGLTPDQPNKPKPLVFENVSLFASAVRNISSIGRLTQGGTVTQVPVDSASNDDAKPQKTISVIWAESALGFSAKERDDILRVTSNRDTISVDMAGRSGAVFSSEYDAEDFPAESHRNAFFVFSHHALPIHPEILQATFTKPSPPSMMEILIASPENPDGRIESWTLKSAEVVRAPFPLSPQTRSVTEHKDVSPIAFVVNQAVRGTALDGPPDEISLLTAMSTAAIEEDWPRAWMASYDYETRFGACPEPDETTPCKAIASVRRQSQWDAETSILSASIKALKSGGLSATERTGLLVDLLPLAEGDTAQAGVLKVLGQERAKLKRADISNTQLADLDAASLLQQSLVMNPYDGETYIGLAQIHAAGGQFEQAWDLYDALRSGISNREDLLSGVTRAESNTRDRARAYFMPKP